MLTRQGSPAFCGILGTLTLYTHSKLVSKHFLCFSQEHLSQQTQVRVVFSTQHFRNAFHTQEEQLLL